MPVFHLLAGPNGAGKSTLYAALVRDGILSADLAFINADLFEREHLQHITDPMQRSQAARDWADAQRAIELVGGESFVSETVFSHQSKLALIDEALAQGHVVALYVLALDDPSACWRGCSAGCRKRGILCRLTKAWRVIRASCVICPTPSVWPQWRIFMKRVIWKMADLSWSPCAKVPK